LTSSNDYQDEMKRDLGLNDQEIDRLFAGAPVENADDLAGFVGIVRYALMEAPSDELTSSHLAAISHAARLLDKASPALDKAAPARLDKAAPRVGVRALMDKALRLGLKVTAIIIAAFTSMMGLAYAGVDLPGTVTEKAVQSVLGFHIPNQSDEDDQGEDEQSVVETDATEADDAKDSEEKDSAGGKSVSDDVHAVQDSFGDTRGCEYGQAVSGTASQNSQGDGDSDKEKCTGGSDGDKQNNGQGAETSEEAKATDHTNGGGGQANNDNAKPEDQAPNGSAATGEEQSSGSNAGGGGSAEKPDNPKKPKADQSGVELTPAPTETPEKTKGPKN
jgi:hypothetical protein